MPVMFIIYTGQSREASSNIALAMTFLRRTYPNHLANYTGYDLPDALDLITSASTTPTPSDGLQLNRRRRHPREEVNWEEFCCQQLTATHDAGLSSLAHYRGGIIEHWRTRRKTGRHRDRPRRRRRHGARSNGGATLRRSDGTDTGDDTPRTLERDDAGGRSSTFVVTEAQSVVLATSSPADSAAAHEGEDTVAAHNATGVDLYFRTAHVLHYASIVILGLFVLQVTQPTTVTTHLSSSLIDIFLYSSQQELNRLSCIKHFKNRSHAQSIRVFSSKK